MVVENHMGVWENVEGLLSSPYCNRCYQQKVFDGKMMTPVVEEKL